MISLNRNFNQAGRKHNFLPAFIFQISPLHNTIRAFIQ
ncbi:hypothetical protein EVA_12985 [gut metagenome]|uniref:Uncharacterized protein n=1 Tax=gut metagenome TaxID=749906 RepID=J9GHJ1_9ZZZZ